jgi:predicted transcriptional regulator
MRIYIFGYSAFFGKNIEMTNVVEILSLIAEPKCSTIFRTMGEFGEPTELHITRLNMTRKQFYSRLNQLIKSDLVKRAHGKYELTLFGKVVFEIEEKIQHSIDNYWKLKAIETLDESLPDAEKTTLINSIVSDPLIRDLLDRNTRRRVTSNVDNKNDPEELVLSI